MVGRPAARVLDPVVHPLPGVLTPGPGSFNVIIGYKPAWRGVPAAAAAALQSAKAASNATLAAAKAAKVAAAGTPGAPAAVLAEETAKTAAAAAMGSAITAAAGGADIHICVTPLPLPPHGPGVVIDGSPTVLINGLPACRQMDTILEALGPPNKIAMGLPTVLIGGISPVAPGTALGSAVAGVNPGGSIVNCGFIIDAAIDRLRGTNPNAAAPVGQDGSFTAIENRHNTSLTWGSDFQSAFDAVRDGGHGTVAIVGISYSGSGSHVVVLANDGGAVGVVEGQNWGAGNPQEVITSPARANTRYNGDGGSNIGWGLVP